MTSDDKTIDRVQPSPGYKVPLPKNWCAEHYDDDVNPPIEQLPSPLTEIVSESKAM